MLPGDPSQAAPGHDDQPRDQHQAPVPRRRSPASTARGADNAHHPDPHDEPHRDPAPAGTEHPPVEMLRLEKVMRPSGGAHEP